MKGGGGMIEDLRLPEKNKKILSAFLENLHNAYKDDLISVTLYGSAASGEFNATHSNVNLVIVLRDASLQALAKIVPTLSKGKFNFLNAVFFTEDYITNSADVFPIEFLDIKENHKILHGKDIFKDLTIDIKNLRFQCEQELKSKIINMKRACLANINNRDLDKLLVKFFTSSLHILRNISRLKGGQSVYNKEDILKKIASEFNIDISNMKKILDAKNQGKRLSRKIAFELFGSFVSDLEKIADSVDGLSRHSK